MRRTSIIRGGIFLRNWLPIGFVLLALACGPAEPIRLGFLGEMYGPAAVLSMAARDGVQLAVNLRNEAGGVNGRRVLLLIKNNRHNPETSRREAQDLIDQGVAAIIGPLTSDMTLAVAPVVDKAKVVCVSPSATTDKLSGKDDYILRLAPTTWIFASVTADYLLRTNTMKKVSVVYDLVNRSYCEMWIENFDKAFTKGGGEVLAKITFRTGKDVNYSKIARQLLAVKPDGIVIAANVVDTALLCQHIRKLAPDLPLALSSWVDQERLIELGGKAVEGAIVTQTYDRNGTDPRYLEFRRLFMDRYGYEPGSASVYSFDAVNLVLDAIADQGMRTLKESLLAITKPYKTMQGVLFLDQYGDVGQDRCWVSVIKDGQFVVAE